MTVLAVDGSAARLNELSRLLEAAFPEDRVIAERDPLAAGKYSFNNPVDILFAAVEMPRLDGLKLVEFVRHANPDAFVFLLVGADADSGLWADEVDGLLPYPVTGALLRDALCRAQRKRGDASHQTNRRKTP